MHCASRTNSGIGYPPQRAGSYQWNYNGYQGNLAQIWNDPQPAAPRRRAFTENKSPTQQIWSESSDSLLSDAERESIFMVAKQLQANADEMKKVEPSDGLKSFLCISHIQEGFCSQGKPVREKVRSNSNTSDYHSDSTDSHKKSLSPRSNSSS
ncbi:unnamed protein product [Bursaphelenchus xylophilus]|uniref:(pine wood nematode) hypothetical protein n=1 Tax=Bursaphelenchus xylophilus TaxID=6326 RepID=A0A1I7RN94_BURXY|nr:unnamed protein product [Bursaphelenchus xylophilus]CAG9123779.1 unnamed protein product [Bursaphelenchus xylophilus]